MAYEDYYKEDPMPNFTDDVSYYDEDLGFYDDFNERLDQSADDMALEDDAIEATEQAADGKSMETPKLPTDAGSE